MPAWSLDARIPIHLLTPGETPAPGMALLAEAPSAASAPAMALFSLTGAHVPACACCGVRGPVAEALDRLFLGRVRVCLTLQDWDPLPAFRVRQLRSVLKGLCCP